MSCARKDLFSVANVLATFAVLAAVVASVVVFWIRPVASIAEEPQVSSPVAVVHDCAGSQYVLALDDDASVEVATEKGRNLVVVENGEVYVSDADCDNHDCMRQGRISRVGDQIICLPHELFIEIVPNESGEALEALELGVAPESFDGVPSDGEMAEPLDGFDSMSR